MFDIGMTELLVIGVVALIVVGPKDLPGMFRTLGRFTAKIKGMAREFQRAMDDAADEAGVKDIRKDLRAATDPRKMGLDRLNDAVDGFEKWTPGKAAKTAGPQGRKSHGDPAAKKGAASPNGAMGPETAKLSAERAASSERLRETAAAAATEREARAAAPVPDPAAPAPVSSTSEATTAAGAVDGAPR